MEVVEFLEEEGRVGGVLAVLSTDWQVVMPPGKKGEERGRGNR